ncbi:MAG: carbohydrate-binding family 9-like protein [Chitinophagaceae bacterium]|nr:carbohydrate-binding family 9-like protein [Chitinophagaceae bacterium]MCW5925801.1 carbohydrate-binding family 9-like protein [Chitinophagaceae bacterium]
MIKYLLYPSYVLACFLFSVTAISQPNYKSQDVCKEDDTPQYTAYRTGKPPKIDGKLNETVWKKAARSNAFVDLISGAKTHLDTRAAVLWDDRYLYVGYWVEEPDITATHTVRDAPIYQDNDVELFIAGTDAYYEFEINSFGTIYEVLFFWMDNFEKKGYHLMPEFNTDAKGARPFRGVGYRHPRGRRIGFWNWDLPGLQYAVHLNGTINNNKDKDKGWTVELAIPWTSLQILAKGDNRSLPPANNDVWKMDFSRFNTKKYSENDSGGWAWSAHGVWDSHVPECFTRIVFSEELLR